MSLIDVVIAVAAVVCAVVVMCTARIGRAPALGLLGGVALVAAVQWLREGFYWQFVPTYLLLVVTAWFVAARPSRRLGGIAARVGVGMLVVAAAFAWVLPPVPTLPAPSGPYPVGTETFRWVDPDRPEAATDDPADRRNVIAQAWYPAAEPTGSGSRYLDGLGKLPRRVSQIPSFLMRGYDRIDTHADDRASLARDRDRWPVVLFSPGYGAPRAFHTGLVADLASRGFVVLAVDHPYEAAVVELADGRLATAVDDFPADDAAGERYMSVRQAVRAADLRFVLDRLERPGALGPRLSGHLDTERIAVIGHSFGGAAAAAAAADDDRIRAAANIDGTLYGDLPNRTLRQPFLLLESEHDETGHSERFLERNAALLGRLGAGGFRFEIGDANHYSFTDAPLFLSGPGRFAVAQLIGGSRGPVPTQRATADILAAFLSEPLGGPRADVVATAVAHRDIRGGAVGH
ncbi:alpha/beta hydrolase family protein [Nocardia sp. bgisy134]|uniref:alpha/beta hydrolase family protein n=1 Tax=Nocardia sp. bgisy134 TaxID=3413789 RepID=UPI003D75A61B